VDIAVPKGTNVYCVESGKIIRLGGAWRGGTGNPDGYNITIDNGSGRQWFYTHLMRRADLKIGQQVAEGDFFGKSGAANGVEHLHIAVNHGDPEILLGLKGQHVRPIGTHKS
jgi:murein DD-endopeptidase MepM/ murein hydrolase activator NlpD